MIDDDASSTYSNCRLWCAAYEIATGTRQICNRVSTIVECIIGAASHQSVGATRSP
jgi:hypothetical protein